MNDRFKFRCMTLGGEWVYGNLAIINKKIKPCGMTVDAGFYISNEVGMPFAYPVRPETIGQCTGLKDKNGKLIYEGDIILVEDNKCPIEWESENARYNVVGYGEIAYLNYNDIEVIGNIHENADLLENEE